MRRKNDQQQPVDRAVLSSHTSRRSKKLPYILNAKKSTNVNVAFQKSENAVKSSIAKSDVDSSSSNSYSYVSDSEHLNTNSDLLQSTQPLTSPIVNETKTEGGEENKFNSILDLCQKSVSGKIETFHQKLDVDSNLKNRMESITKEKDLILNHNTDDSLCSKTNLISNFEQDHPQTALKINFSDTLLALDNIAKNCLTIDSMSLKDSSNSTDDDSRREKKCVTGSILVERQSINFAQNNKQTNKSNETTRKRKWLSKRSKEPKGNILSISSDSLKKIISDVIPVPLSDVKLESSSEVEEVFSDKSEFRIASPKCKVIKSTGLENNKANFQTKTEITKFDIMKTYREDLLLANEYLLLQKPPSPPKNESSTILFITNLVRPFTLLQLKGLLARTGRIVADGFWIDRIKSKCYVQYETEE